MRIGILVAFGLVGNVWANDSTYGYQNSEIVFIPNEDIKLEREDLYISPHKITVDYVFENLTSEDVSLDITFPIIRAGDAFDGDVDVAAPLATPTSGEATVTGELAPFQTSINGQSVISNVETVVLWQNKNIAPYFEERGINPTGYDFGEFVAEMQARGYLDDDFNPSWIVIDHHIWHATFPANRTTTVHHEYDPSTASGFTSIDDALFGDDRFCIEKDFRNGVEAKLTARQEQPYFRYQTVDYLLGPGRNWAGPIGSLNVTIDKVDPSALVSLCADGVEKISSTEFQYRLKDYEPADGEKIEVLILN